MKNRFDDLTKPIHQNGVARGPCGQGYIRSMGPVGQSMKDLGTYAVADHVAL